MASITSANAIFTLSITGLFPTPQQLQGFATDDAFANEAIEAGEFLMGVDGKMSGGFVFTMYPQTIAFQADSTSIQIFEIWHASQITAKDIFFANGVITMKSVGTKYALTKGGLKSFSPIAEAKKVLQPRRFGLIWESISSAVA